MAKEHLSSKARSDLVAARWMRMTRGVNTVKRTSPFGPSTTCEGFGEQAKRSDIPQLVVSTRKSRAATLNSILVL